MTRGWTNKEKEELIKLAVKATAKKIPLKDVFENFGKKYNRKGDSVRNFYYAVLSESKLRGELITGIEKVDIEMFGEKEVVNFMSSIMNQCANGATVRGAIMKITKDKTKMLRYQNKYRNLVKCESSIIYKIMEKQKMSGRYFDPFKKVVVELSETPLKVLVSDDKLRLRKEADSLSEKINAMNDAKYYEKSPRKITM